MLKIHETYDANGAPLVSFLKVEEGELCLVLPDAEIVIPTNVLVRVFERYGKPLDDVVILHPETSITLEDGLMLYALRHLARFDVIAKDYLVLARVDKEPLAELSVSIYGALVHLAQRAV
jgi:hypothetical protein